MGTIKDIIPSITNIFNEFVKDAPTQGYFKNTLHLWENEQTYFKSTDIDKMSSIIYKYSIHINKQLDIEISIKDGYTKITETERKNDRLEKSKNDEITTQNIIYPDGYTGTTDIAYLKTEQKDKPSNNEVNVDELETDTLKETDILSLARLKFEAPKPRIAKYVNMLIFEFIKQGYL